MDLREASARAREIRALLAELETKRHGRPWSVEEIALGFVGDVGDLVKLVQASEGVREIDDLPARLAHELADCLWCVLVLADKLGVDLERGFAETMDRIEEYARKHLAEGGAPGKS